MRHAPAPIPPLCADSDYAALKHAVIEATGLAYYLDKDDDLADRLDRRFRAVDASDCGEYLSLLRDPLRGQQELDRLVEHLTVGETSFFRHSEIFDGLRTVIMPHLLERNRQRRCLRVWCAGCSIGAEAYTLSILFARELAGYLDGWDVSIVGTDINRDFLARAREGVFNSWQLRGIDQDTLSACFSRCGDAWRIRPEFRERVTFQYHNLVRSPFPSLLNNLSALDLIFCRNVLIYFSPDIMRQIVTQFRESLVDGGWLLVGHAEPNVQMFRDFRTVNVPGAVLYQRPEEPSPISPSPALRSTPDAPRVLFADAHPNTRRATPVSANTPAASADITPSTRRPRAPRTLCGDAREWAEIEHLANAGDLDAAVQRCERLAADHPADPAAYLRLAMLAEQLGRHRMAEASLRKTLALSPDNPLAHYLTGLLEQKAGRRAGAIAAYTRTLHALDAHTDQAVLSGLNELTAGELRELVRMQQETLAT